MSKRMRTNDGSARWVARSVTVNSTDCTISFFEPPVREASTTLVPQTPDRALPSIEHDIKYDSPTEYDEVDLIPCSFPEPNIKEELKEEPDENRIRLDQVPVPSVSNHALAQSGIAQLQQFAALPEQRINHQRNVTPDEEALSNSEEYLSSLLEQFNVKRDSPGSSSIFVTPPSRKRKRSNDSNLTPDRPTSSSSSREMLASASAADFFRHQANQLPTKHKPHEWTFEQRQALCLIHMFYEVDTAFEGITRVLNKYFQCPPGDYFRPLQVRTQFSFWRYTFRKRPVYDPKHEWLHKKDGYEAAASRAGVRLMPRNSPLKEKRLSPRTEKTAERVATQDAWFLGKLLSLRDASRHDTSPVASPDVSPLAGRSTSETEDDTIIVATPSTPTASSSNQSASSQKEPPNTAVKEEGDTIDPPTPYRPAQASIAYAAAASQEGKDTSKPTLLYRVYHDESGGLNSPTHFRAGLFNIPGQSLEPPPADSGILPVFVSWHLWHHSVSSPFISCTDSLIMAIHKARQAEQDGLNPHLSIINADTAIAEGRRGFPAYPLVVEARKRGLVPGMRYRGLREYLIWGEISQESIIYDLPFQVLRTLTLSDFAVADLLALDDIDPAPRMSLGRIRRSLLGQEIILDESAGHAVGRLVALFGLGTLSPPEAIRQFVYDLFQGWVLGVHRIWAMAEEFVVGLQEGEARSGGAVVVLDDCEEAELKAGFVNGILRAQEDLKKERRLMRK